MIKLKDIKIGSKVEVAARTGERVIGTVTSVEADVKNGQPGIDYVDGKGEGYWAYLDQVVRIIKR